jgi:hypothetical protein
VPSTDPSDGPGHAAWSVHTDHSNGEQGSIETLATAVGGGFDVVLCHFVLQYRSSTGEDVQALAAAPRPGGLLSIIAPNPADAVLAEVVRNGPAAALTELDTQNSRTVTFDRDVRKITDSEMRTYLEAAGCRVIAQYGGRCANALITDNDAKYDPSYYADLEQLEIALCGRERFKRVGMFWQLVATSANLDSSCCPSGAWRPPLILHAGLVGYPSTWQRPTAAVGRSTQLSRSSSRTVTVSPTPLPSVRRTSALTGSLCVPSPSAMNELWNGWPSMVPRTFTRPRVPKYSAEPGICT